MAYTISVGWREGVLTGLRGIVQMSSHEKVQTLCWIRKELGYTEAE